MITSRKSILRSVPFFQIRTLKRRPAYPQSYKAETVPLGHPKKDHSSFFQRHLKKWLGPVNIRGEFYRNKYYFPPQNHKPNYIVPDGKTVVDPSEPESVDERRYKEPKRDPSLQPFPHNPHCRTALMISNKLKDQICKDVNENGLHSQEAAHKYGIKVSRIEAIIRLRNIEAKWSEQKKIDKDLASFAEIMYRMFPLYEPPISAENLTEIPTPSKTLHQRFLTISESEPFGPVDAAKLFELEPASETLNKLAQFHEQDEKENVKFKKVSYGLERQDDRSTFKFTHAKSGDVGHRYGASRRDRKKDRSIAFDNAGRMFNL